MRLVILLILVVAALAVQASVPSEEVLETHWRLRQLQTKYATPGCSGIVKTDVIMPFNQLVAPGSGMGGVSPVPTTDYSRHSNLYVPVLNPTDRTREMAVKVVAPGWVALHHEAFAHTEPPVLALETHVSSAMRGVIAASSVTPKLAPFLGKARMALTSTSKYKYEDTFVPLVFRLCGRIDMGPLVARHDGHGFVRSRFGLRLAVEAPESKSRLVEFVLRVAVLRDDRMDVEEVKVVPVVEKLGRGKGPKTYVYTFASAPTSVATVGGGGEQTIAQAVAGFGDHHTAIGAEVRLLWGNLDPRDFDNKYPSMRVSDIALTIEGQHFPVVWGAMLDPEWRPRVWDECAPVYADGEDCLTHDQLQSAPHGVAAVLRGGAAHKRAAFEQFLDGEEGDVQARGAVAASEGFTQWHAFLFVVAAFAFGVVLFVTAAALLVALRGRKPKTL